jgi:PAS domain S-box-containing protein
MSIKKNLTPAKKTIITGQEEELIFSKRNFKLFWDTMDKGVFYFSRRGKVILMNPAAVRILGHDLVYFQNVKPDDVLRDTCGENGLPMPGKDHPGTIALRTGQEVKDAIVGVYNPLEQGYRWIKISATPLFKRGESKPYLAYIIFDDITDLRRSQEALRQSEERFRKMFEDHEAIMLLIDPSKGRILDGNLSAVRFYGYPREVLRSMNITDINILKDEQTFGEMQKAVKLESTSFIFQHRLAGGNIRTVEVHSSPIIMDNRPILFSIIYDITAREKSEQALQISEKRYRDLLDSMDEGFMLCEMIYDENGKAVDFRYLIVNKALAEILNKPVEMLIGSANRDLFPEIDPMWVETFDEITKSGISRRVIGTRKRYGITMEIFAWRSGPGRVGVTFNDITEQRQMGAKIKQLYRKEKIQRKKLQEEAKIKNLFIDMVAHELRNPLTSILSSSGMLQDSLGKNNEEMKTKLASNINRGAVMMSKRVDELLDVARFTRGNYTLYKKAINIRIFLQDVVERFKSVLAEKEQVLHLFIKGEPGEIVADQTRLEQVIVNLLSNANKFSPERSSIYLTARKKYRKLVIEVKDEGIGIAKEDLGHIFEAYHRFSSSAGAPGTGLGLFISKLLVEAHNGNIQVASQSGHGSVFTISIPVNLRPD